MRQAPDPFRLLLYLEWLLLGIATLAVVLPIPPSLDPQFHVPSFLCMVGFGLMGLRLSKVQTVIQKAIFTGVEVVLISLPFILIQQNHSVPFLTTILVIRGCQMFKLPGQLTVLGLGLGVSILSLVQEPSFTNILSVMKQATENKALVSDRTILMLKFNMGLSFGLTLAAVFLLVNSILTERQNRQELIVAHEKLHQYALRIEDQATLQERNRIAREIHDSLGHTLTAQSIQLENALLFCPAEAEKTQSFLMQSKLLCTNALREVRQSVSTLRSNPLQGRSLAQILAETIQDFRQATDITLESVIDLPQSLSTEINIVIYRIIQEALTNIYKHSSANQVKIEVYKNTDEMIVRIQDNGKGFNPEQNTTGFGLQGIRERVISWGGHFHVGSQPGHGCHITAHLPMSRLILAG
jgi:signal transduction histidine kinase